MQFFRAFISYSIFFVLRLYIYFVYLCITFRIHFVHLKNATHFFHSFAKTYRLDLRPRRDTDSLFCGRWIFLRLPEIQWRRRSPLFMATGRCCRPHTSPLVSFYTFSLYRLITRDVFQSLLSSPQPSRCISSLFPTLWQDTAATDNIYYKTWPSMPVFHARVSLCSGQSEKRNSLPDDESRRLIGERINDIISYLCSILHLSGYFYLSILFSAIKRYAILIFSLYSNYR